RELAESGRRALVSVEGQKHRKRRGEGENLLLERIRKGVSLRFPHVETRRDLLAFGVAARRQGAEKLVDHRPKRLVSRLALDPHEKPSRDLNARAKLLDEPRLSASMRAGDDERLRLGGVPFDRFERGRDPRELRVAEEERPRREPARAGSRGRGDRAHGILAERLGERAQRFPSASEPIIRPLLEQSMDERDERLRKIRPKRRERRRRRLEVLLEKDASIARIERRPSREED